MQAEIPAKTKPIGQKQIGRYLVADPEICHGKLTFAGTRVLVRPVLAYIASGKTIDWVLSEWPQLSREAITEAIHLATDSLIERYESQHAA